MSHRQALAACNGWHSFHVDGGHDPRRATGTLLTLKQRSLLQEDGGTPVFVRYQPVELIHDYAVPDDEEPLEDGRDGDRSEQDHQDEHDNAAPGTCGAVSRSIPRSSNR